MREAVGPKFMDQGIERHKGISMNGLSSKKPAFEIALAFGVLFLCVINCDFAAGTSPQPAPSLLVQNDATSREVNPRLTFLKGRWRRPDGGYVIDVRDVDSTGKMDAAYFNPKPINVSKAEATREGSATKVFIELRDAGYPGCTYTLTYDPQTDQLKGVYFQASIQQNFEVIFFRIK